jgi:hypothetical protein
MNEVERLRRQVHNLEAQLALVELERSTDRATASEAIETIRSLTAIKEELSEALRQALAGRDRPLGQEDPSLEKALRERDYWRQLATERLDKLRALTNSRPSRLRRLIRWLRKASPF